MVKLPNFQPILYRDDGLGITSSTPRQTEKLRQTIIKVFKDHNLNITIDVGLFQSERPRFDFGPGKRYLQAFRKPGDKPLYVSAWSKHPPGWLKTSPLVSTEGYLKSPQTKRFSLRQPHLTKQSWRGVDTPTSWSGFRGNKKQWEI